MTAPDRTEQDKFLSTPSARRATIVHVVAQRVEDISIHALREEGDPRTTKQPLRPSNFYPRPPRGGRPPRSRHTRSILYFYPRPPRGGRLLDCLDAGVTFSISIHALREEGDMRPARPTRNDSSFLSTPSARRATPYALLKSIRLSISIHALREEGDLSGVTTRQLDTVFLSTPSARRATVPCVAAFGNVHNFYPRPPRGGRPSIGETVKRIILISIHALREEGDWFHQIFRSAHPDFYPRPPRGGRHDGGHDRQEQAAFLSTPSARRATRTA